MTQPPELLSLETFDQAYCRTDRTTQLIIFAGAEEFCRVMVVPPGDEAAFDAAVERARFIVAAPMLYAALATILNTRLETMGNDPWQFLTFAKNTAQATLAHVAGKREAP